MSKRVKENFNYFFASHMLFLLYQFYLIFLDNAKRLNEINPLLRNVVKWSDMVLL